MIISDPIADLAARIKNAQLRSKELITLPLSNIVLEVANILQQEGFVSGVKTIEGTPRGSLEVTLKYDDNGTPAMRDAKRISKPGVRRYSGYKEIRKIKNGQGIVILSTPNGLLTGQQARDQKVGGEILLEIW